ncbi:hypothetical protein [Burkholderia anthina]|uniref:hypothetical protein n=1 Tax=Burkholderia anthina TaxID=179879 RepID=UPI00158DAE60|nr:hypothetical protein [Burkholderia anthina]
MRIGSIRGSIRAIYSGNIAMIARCRALSAAHAPAAISGITIKIAQKQSSRKKTSAPKNIHYHDIYWRAISPITVSRA